MKRNSHGNFQRKQTFKSIQGAEKIIYIIGIPILICVASYQIYKKKASEEVEQAARVDKIERTYLEKHTNVIKLQNFNKKVFAIGVLDDIMDDPSQAAFHKTDEFRMKIIENAQLIRKVVRDLQAEQVVLELCDERYETELEPIIDHPNYNHTME